MYELLKYRDRAFRENAECAAQALHPAHLRRRRARTAAKFTAQPDRRADHLLDDYCRAPYVVASRERPTYRPGYNHPFGERCSRSIAEKGPCQEEFRNARRTARIRDAGQQTGGSWSNTQSWTSARG